MSDLSKNRDEDGVWTGGWRVLVKLRQQNNITQHLPNSFFIGREKGICFYAGQPRRCFKCGKAGHVASVCSMVKCSLCNEMGHVSATCQNIRCNLCGRIGHPHRDCPDAWHNICKDSPDEDLLAAADDIQEEALLSGSVVTEAEPQPHTGDTTQDQAESGPIETTMEVVEQVVQPSVVVSSPARSSNNNKRRKKDKASRKPEGEWTTVEKPTKMRVSSADLTTPIDLPYSADLTIPIDLPYSADLTTPIDLPYSADLTIHIDLPYSADLTIPIDLPYSAYLTTPIDLPYSADLTTPIDLPYSADLTTPIDLPYSADLTTPISLLAPLADRLAADLAPTPELCGDLLSVLLAMHCMLPSGGAPSREQEMRSEEAAPERNQSQLYYRRDNERDDKNRNVPGDDGKQL
ncbi:uncharacterized protein RB166_007479 [Leptodactylus fuscus]